MSVLWKRWQAHMKKKKRKRKGWTRLGKKQRFCVYHSLVNFAEGFELCGEIDHLAADSKLQSMWRAHVATHSTTCVNSNAHLESNGKVNWPSLERALDTTPGGKKLFAHCQGRLD